VAYQSIPSAILMYNHLFHDTDGVYRPLKFMPTSVDDEEKRRKKDSRRDKALA